jgi:LytTr DNA-binding domain-containing protein
MVVFLNHTYKFTKSNIMKSNLSHWLMGKDILFADFILTKLRGEHNDIYQYFFIKDVKYFKSYNKTTLVYLVNSKVIIVLHIRFKVLMKLLPGNHFGRHSNSYIINYHRVKISLPFLCDGLYDEDTNGMISRDHLKIFRGLYKLLKVGFGLRRPRIR